MDTGYPISPGSGIRCLLVQGREDPYKTIFDSKTMKTLSGTLSREK